MINVMYEEGFSEESFSYLKGFVRDVENVTDGVYGVELEIYIDPDFDIEESDGYVSATLRLKREKGSLGLYSCVEFRVYPAHGAIDDYMVEVLDYEGFEEYVETSCSEIPVYLLRGLEVL